MIRLEILGTATTPDRGEITLTRDAVGFVITADDRVLMSSRKHGSEEAMAKVACRALCALERPRVLVAGLGLGYTLRATLDGLPPTAEVVCVELIEAIVKWHRGPLGPVAGHPIDDPRVTIEIGDHFAARLRKAGFATEVVRVAARSGRRRGRRCRQTHVLLVGCR